MINEITWCPNCKRKELRIDNSDDYKSECYFCGYPNCKQLEIQK